MEESGGTCHHLSSEEGSLWSLALTLWRVSALGGWGVGAGGWDIHLDVSHPSQGQDKAHRRGHSGLGLYIRTHPAAAEISADITPILSQPKTVPRALWDGSQATSPSHSSTRPTLRKPQPHRRRGRAMPSVAIVSVLFHYCLLNAYGGLGPSRWRLGLSKTFISSIEGY